MISGFRREVAENRALLGYYAMSSGNFLPTFRDNLSVLSSEFKNRFLNPEDKTDRLFQNYHYSLRNNPEERGSQVLGRLFMLR